MKSYTNPTITCCFCYKSIPGQKITKNLILGHKTPPIRGLVTPYAMSSDLIWNSRVRTTIEPSGKKRSWNAEFGQILFLNVRTVCKSEWQHQTTFKPSKLLILKHDVKWIREQFEPFFQNLNVLNSNGILKINNLHIYTFSTSQPLHFKIPALRIRLRCITSYTNSANMYNSSVQTKAFDQTYILDLIRLHSLNSILWMQ